MAADLSYLPRQTRRRIEAWVQELSKHLYTPLLPLVWEGFFTYDLIPMQEVSSRTFTLMPEGTKWGSKGQYGWFRTRFTLAKEFQGVVLCTPIGVGGESIVYFDGHAVGSIDRQHRLAFLSFDAQPGSLELLVEAYAGSGELLENCGPVPLERPVYPPVPETQQQITSPTVGRIEEPLYQLWLDVQTLISLLRVLEPTSLQAQRTVEALVQFTMIVEFEGTYAELLNTCLRAREVLKPVLSFSNGSCAPTFSVFGQSHIDLAWKWTVEETKRKCARTYSNQLTLLRQYDDYTFLLCEPALIDLLETHHPRMYEEVMEFVRKKRILTEGAFWVEADTNLPSAESLARQLRFGQMWFLSRTGSFATFGWLPDTFGFSASLPQLLVQAGVESFGTQKLLRADPESDPFPFTDFWWEGEDGSRLLANMCFRNNCEISAEQLYSRWHVDRRQQEHIDALIFPFGYGDGGGGPDRDLVESMVRLKDLQGLPRLRFEGPVQYFERIRSNVGNVHKGELYLAWHRGTYSSQHSLKQLNALCEQLLFDYGWWSTALGTFECSQYETWWKTVLFNQFHDILAGVSIKEVNDRALAELESVRRCCLDAIESVPAIGDPDAYTVLCTLSWPTKAWVRLNRVGQVYQNGNAIPCYQSGSATWALADLNPGSATILRFGELRETQGGLVGRCEAGYRVTGKQLSFTVNEMGFVTDVRHNGRLLCKRAGEVRLLKDINPDYDAWEISKLTLAGEGLKANVEALRLVVDRSDLAVFEVELTVGTSRIVQTIRFADDQTIDFLLKVDWNERHKLLKSCFTHELETDSYLCDTQLGYKRLNLHRNTTSDRDRYEVCAQRYAAVSDESCSLVLSNSYPFGLSASFDQLELTLLRSALVPDERGEQGMHELSYSLAIFDGPFSGSKAKQHALARSHYFPVLKGRFEFEAPVLVLQGEVVLTALEPADESTVVLRLSNPGLKMQKVKLVQHFNAYQAWICDLLLRQQQPLSITDGCLEFEMPPFAFRTIKLTLEKPREVQSTCGIW